MSKVYKNLIAIAFSGGYDSSYFLKQICLSGQSQRYFLLHYVVNYHERKYSYNHLKVLQFAYQLNMKFKIIMDDLHISYTKNCSKYKRRHFRFNTIYNFLSQYRVKNICFLFNHLDVVESFIMRQMSDSKMYGLATCYSTNYYVHYNGFRIHHIRPIIDTLRGFIESNVSMVCSDGMEDSNNLRIAIRGELDKNKFYRNVIEYINELKNALPNIEFQYSSTNLILKIKNIYDDLIYACCYCVRLLNYTVNNKIRLNRISLENKNFSLNKCSVSILNDCIAFKLNHKYIQVIQSQFKTEVILNSIHKLTFFHSNNISVTMESKIERKSVISKKSFQTIPIFNVHDRYSNIVLKVKLPCSIVKFMNMHVFGFCCIRQDIVV